MLTSWAEGNGSALAKSLAAQEDSEAGLEGELLLLLTPNVIIKSLKTEHVALPPQLPFKFLAFTTAMSQTSASIRSTWRAG